MEKIGHRGAKAWVAENTIESIDKAIELGADAIEIDVHRCKTGELIVIHDKKVNRTTNGRGSVKKLPYSKIEKLRTNEGYSIPTLAEVLSHCKGKCNIHIELKGKKTALPTAVLLNDVVLEGGWDYDQFFVSSFKLKLLKKVKKVQPLIKLGVIAERKLQRALLLAVENKYEAVYVQHSKLRSRFMKQAKAHGLKVYTWTVNRPQDIAKMTSLGVDGIISDYPDRL